MLALLRQCLVLVAVLVLSGCLPSTSDADPDKRADAAIELQSFAGGFANASVAAASQTVNNPKWAKGEIAEGPLNSVSLSGMNGQKMSNAFCKDGTGKGYFVSWLNTTSGALNEGVSSGTVLAGLSKVLPQDQIGHGNGKTVKYLNGVSLSLSGCTGLDIPVNAPVIVNAVKAVPVPPPVVNAQNVNVNPQYAGVRVTLGCGLGHTGEIVKESQVVPASPSSYHWVEIVNTCAPDVTPVASLDYLASECNGAVMQMAPAPSPSPSLAANVRNQVNTKIWDVSGCEKSITAVSENKILGAIQSVPLPQEEMIVGCANSPPAGRETIGQFSGTFTSTPWVGELKLKRNVTAYGENIQNQNAAFLNENTDKLYGAWEKHNAKCESTQKLTITCDSVRPYMAKSINEKTENFEYTRDVKAVGALNNNVFGFAPNTYSTWILQTDPTGCQWREIDENYYTSCLAGEVATKGTRVRTVTANGSVSRGDYTYAGWVDGNPKSNCVPITGNGRTVTAGTKSYNVECRNGYYDTIDALGNYITYNAYVNLANVDVTVGNGYIDAYVRNSASGRKGYVRFNTSPDGSGGLNFNSLNAQPGYRFHMCYNHSDGNSCTQNTLTLGDVNCVSNIYCRVRDNSNNNYIFDSFSSTSRGNSMYSGCGTPVHNSSQSIPNW